MGKLEFHYKQKGLPQTFMVVAPTYKSSEVLAWLSNNKLKLINIKPVGGQYVR